MYMNVCDDERKKILKMDKDLQLIFHLEFENHEVDEYNEVYLQNFHIRKNQRLKKRIFNESKEVSLSVIYLEVFHWHLELICNE